MRFRDENEFRTEWSSITLFLRTHVANLSTIKLTPERDSAGDAMSEKGSYLFELINMHYGNTRKALRHLSDDLDMPYSTLMTKINGKNPWGSSKDRLCRLLDIHDDERKEYFDD